jgi:hypothetical protein
MKAKPQKVNRSSKKLPLILLCALVVIAALAYWLWPSRESQTTAQPPHSTSKVTPPKGVPAVVGNTGQQGGAVDLKGQPSSSLPPSSQWTSSPSGNITIQQPISGQTLHTGDTISGTAKVDTVAFILKDNAVGVIANGTLSVVNGKFAGSLGFTAHSGSGILEVYYPDPSTGAEKDLIKVNVNYSI